MAKMNRAVERFHIFLFLMALALTLSIHGELPVLAAPLLAESEPDRFKKSAMDGTRMAFESLNRANPLFATEQPQDGSREIPSALAEKRSVRTSVATGWPVANGYVVTNNHVLSESSHVVLITASGQEIEACAVLRDDVDDIAILEVSDSNQLLPPALPLAHSAAKLGSSVFTLGFPRIDVMGRTPKLSEGVISGANGLYDNPASFQTTVPIQPGNSGGPLLNMRGEVVGVMKSMLGIMDDTRNRFYVLPNTSYAVKISSVKQLLDLLPPKNPPFAELPIRSDTLEILADRIQNSVLIVTTE
jgi:S1-C subfamily serine protease